MQIDCLPAFTDNYIWVISKDDACGVVDPGDAQPVKDYLSQTGKRLDTILVTHHHADHTGGVAELVQQTGCCVVGPAGIDVVTDAVQDGDTLAVLGEHFTVLAIPGHTLDHLAYVHPAALFCGDTLFSGGCGRMFEGTAPMFVESLNRLKALPPDTPLYCAHEYTLINLSFAAAVEPHNPDIQAAIAQAQQWRSAGACTLPSSLAAEYRINPFLRCTEPDVVEAASQHAGHPCSNETAVFSAIRAWKDSFNHTAVK